MIAPYLLLPLRQPRHIIERQERLTLLRDDVAVSIELQAALHRIYFRRDAVLRLIDIHILRPSGTGQEIDAGKYRHDVPERCMDIHSVTLPLC